MYMVVPLEQKLNQLAAFMAAHRKSKAIVFMLTCAGVDFAFRVLPRVPQLQGIPIFSLHGQAPHAKRLGPSRG
jgi:superfamily II DNA/RNA helicase